MLAEMRAHFAAPEGFSLGDFRDHFDTSRKYALAFLEHLDDLGVTRRGEDVRYLNVQVISNVNQSIRGLGN